MDLAVQAAVDRLAVRVGRPAVLEDRHFRLVAYSSHDESVDDVREASILQRHAPAEVSRWLNALGIGQARRPIRVPGNPELHMLPRICVPVRHKDLLLGYLFFVDPDESMTSSDLEWCVQEGAELGAQLHQDSVAGLVPSARAAESVRMLLMDSPMAAVARATWRRTVSSPPTAWSWRSCGRSQMITGPSRASRTASRRRWWARLSCTGGTAPAISRVTTTACW